MKTNQIIEPAHMRILSPADAEKYREVRLNALHENPPAFGTPRRRTQPADTDNPFTPPENPKNRLVD